MSIKGGHILCYYGFMSKENSRIVGIDYGKKRIGIAFSDESREFAFPHDVFLNKEGVLEEVIEFLKVNNTDVVVVGESKNFEGGDNKIMVEARKFVETLRAAGMTVIYEPELFSTMQAERLQGRRDDIDASAAAVILQSYLDRLKFQK